MPIHKDLKSLYPDNWDEISAGIKAEQDHKCAECGVPDRIFIFRFSQEADSWRNVDDIKANEFPAGAPVYIILTTAHIDQNPANNNRNNLKALCQMCHNRLDGPHRAHRRRIRHDKEVGQKSLFEL